MYSFKSAHPSAFFVLSAGFAIAFSAPAQNPAQPAPANDHLPVLSARINALAHRVIDAGLKSNGLAGEGLKPWHLKLDFQMVTDQNPNQKTVKPISGTVEEWSTGPDQWARAYSGAPGMNGSEWSVNKIERYQSKPGHDGFDHDLLTVRVARPVIDPLYQAANIKHDYEMEVKRVTTAGVALNCTSVVNPSRYAPQTNPDFLFPTLCFDSDLHLRLEVAGDTTVQFDDLQPFQNRMVARDVKVIINGRLNTEAKVSVLEPLAPADADRVKPEKDAIAEPFHIEPGFPRPESTYEVAASLPIQGSGLPFVGTYVVPILIHKDGTVKVQPGANIYPQDLKDALERAVEKWKYKPYLVEGQPVEVADSVAYVLDGKPFVPSYEKPKPVPVVSSPGDYSSLYDPKRDPEKDLAMAEAAASQAHKRILVVVGGDWCVWCHTMDKFFTDHADLRDMRDGSFVLMKVNMGPLNENTAFLSKYPKIPAYPFLFVLDADGKMLAAQPTGALENGANNYSPDLMRKFLAAWKP